ncbi:hypothetical protein FGG08_005773 [Glutinoglossum americanum]|uniref:MARVEL domain-containing protein n=1 Tax=Glutinoglossum americanum TaxID=1670608 RepID=A0A9P8I2B5_9PEZI|nr:hypothetical protein FGG08_005773 [Glutinoglossum americanum]
MGFREYNLSAGGSVHIIPRAILRLLLFVFALAVCGLYGTDLSNAHEHGIGANPKWVCSHKAAALVPVVGTRIKFADITLKVYAVVVGGLSAVTSLIYGIPLVKSHFLFAWDAILFILWIAVFGIFGKMYIHEDPEGNADIMRMKNAVWVDLVNAILWLISGIYGALSFRNRSPRSHHTGRATV